MDNEAYVNEAYADDESLEEYREKSNHMLIEEMLVDLSKWQVFPLVLVARLAFRDPETYIITLHVQYSSYINNILGINESV